MPKQREDRIGLLVVRALVEQGHRLVVQFLDVDPPRPDRIIGIAESPAAAGRVLTEWLELLVATSAEGSVPPEGGGDAAVIHP